MTRKALPSSVFLVVVLTVVPAFADWGWFIGVDTVDPDLGWSSDGRLYMDPSAWENAGGLVQTGALVQFILDVEGDGFTDPLEYFDLNQSGALDEWPEMEAAEAWLRAGALPLDDDILLPSPVWDGTTTLVSPGVVWEYAYFPGYEMTGTVTGQPYGWRAWSATPEQMAGFHWPFQIWYTDGVEKGSYSEFPGHEYEGWWVGAPTGADPDYWMWTGTIGYEVYVHDQTGDPAYRSANILDRELVLVLAAGAPEPDAILLMGGSALLLAIFGKKQFSLSRTAQ